MMAKQVMSPSGGTFPRSFGASSASQPAAEATSAKRLKEDPDKTTDKTVMEVKEEIQKYVLKECMTCIQMLYKKSLVDMEETRKSLSQMVNIQWGKTNDRQNEYEKNAQMMFKEMHSAMALMKAQNETQEARLNMAWKEEVNDLKEALKDEIETGLKLTQASHSQTINSIKETKKGRDKIRRKQGG